MTLHIRLQLPSAEVDLLVGDRAKAEEKMGWKPQVSFKELVHMMVDSDLKLISDEQS